MSSGSIGAEQSTRPAARSVKSSNARGLKFPESISSLPYGRLIAVSFFLMSVVRWEPAPVDLAVLTLVMALGLNFLRSPVQFRTSVPLLLLWLVILLVQLASIGRSEDMGVSLRHWLITCLMGSFFWIGYYVGQNERYAFVALRSFCIGAAVFSSIALLAFFRFIPGFGIVAYTGIRLQGFFKDPNVFAPSSMAALVVALDWVLHGRITEMSRLRSLAHYSMVLILGASIVFAASRASYGGALVTVVVYLAFFLQGARRLRGRALRATVGLLVLAPVLLRLIPNNFRSFVESRFSQNPESDNRFHVQQMALERVGEFPLLGHGPLSTTLNFGVGTHNLFVLQIYEYGLVGLILMLTICIPPLVWSMRWVTRATNPMVSRLAMIYTAVLCGQFANSMFIDSIHWRHLWFFVGAAWALPMLVSREDTPTVDPDLTVAT